jgi:hypothetical protein
MLSGRVANLTVTLRQVPRAAHRTTTSHIPLSLQMKLEFGSLVQPHQTFEIKDGNRNEKKVAMVSLLSIQW